MTKKMIIVTVEDLKYIFSITGMEQYTVSDVSSAEDVLMEKINDEAIGLIIIEEKLFKELSLRTQYILEKRWEGVICKLPSAGELREESFVMEQIRRVLGYQIRIT